ncbi:MAG TPA: hypothetical protein VIL83_09000 [Capillibacterium sp.]
MAKALKLKEKEAKKIGVKKEGAGYLLKSANPKPEYLKSIEIAVKEMAASCEQKK